MKALDDAEGTMATQRTVLTAAESSEGFLLLDSSLNPLFVNSAAAEILSYPRKPEKQKKLDDFLVTKIRSTLFSERASRASSPVTTFQSGRRVYQCRSYRFNAFAKGEPGASLAVLLERSPRGPIPLVHVSEKFHLTNREQEVFQYLSDGRTTKEIALGMEISPNTVKAFLRVIMLKMGVSTRSGIVGKAISTQL
jgi:DNA-binding CsgD family transcriptional regulator